MTVIIKNLMKPVKHRWIPRDIVGGNSALNLVNTVSGWGYDSPEDWIPDVASFLTWARMSSVLNGKEELQALRFAKRSPAAAERVLAAVRELRFALWRLISCFERGKAVDTADLFVINAWKANLALSEEVTAKNNRIAFTINSDVSALELPSLRITRTALLFLKDLPSPRVKTCPGADCGWKFLDQSRNRSRRWCDMKVCGNLVKAREYRARTR